LLAQKFAGMVTLFPQPLALRYQVDERAETPNLSIIFLPIGYVRLPTGQVVFGPRIFTLRAPPNRVSHSHHHQSQTFFQTKTTAYHWRQR
jgi:hypothetical protein